MENKLKEIAELVKAEGNEKQFEYKGFKCRIVRPRAEIDSRMIHLCGYVEIPESHKLYGQEYDSDDLSGLEVHGGITFAKKTGVFGVYLIGFDCAHSGDIFSLLDFLFYGTEEYRTMDYVKNELKILVDQIIEME